MNQSSNAGVKTAINSVLQSLPDDVSWDEVHYRLYVRQQIETGLADSDANRIVDTDEMRKRLSDRKRQSRESCWAYVHAKPDLRVFLKWMIYRTGSVIVAVIPLGRAFIIPQRC